jgi:hypothetical protein
LLPAISRKACGCGDRVGYFQPQAVGIGAQIGFVFPAGDVRQSHLIKTAWLGHP